MIDPIVLPVTVNDELTKAVGSAVSMDEIRASVLAVAQQQAAAQIAEKVKTDAVATKAASDAVAVAANQTFKRTISINGRDFEFEDDSELSLERQISNALQVANALAPTREEPVTPVVETPKGLTEEEKVAASAELELKFKRGEITASDYIEQSGAVDSYLAKKGVSIDTLRETVERSQSVQFEQSWATATEEFLKSPGGADWPGGDQNKTLIGMKIAELNLVDAKDKVAALTQAYAAMKTQGLVFPAAGQPEKVAAVAEAVVVASPAVAAAGGIVPTAKPAAAAPVVKPAGSSSLFGASSGVSAGAAAGKSTADVTYDIPANASPAEILDAWKKAQVAAGKDPNAAFTETFSSRRA